MSISTSVLWWQRCHAISESQTRRPMRFAPDRSRVGGHAAVVTAAGL